MKHAFVFPGQGSQFPGMGKDHYNNSVFAKKLFEQSNDVLGFRLSDIMLNGTEEDLKQTNVTQPAVFSAFDRCLQNIKRCKPRYGSRPFAW
jgi:[acyl-carrier-protein] S-malonyltransferase